MRQPRHASDTRSWARRWVDNAIEAVAPGWAFDRAVSRLHKEYLLQGSGYDGARTTRGMSSWVPGGGSADQAMVGQREMLVDRCRSLRRSNPLASGMIDSWVLGTIGTGITYQSAIDGKALGLTPDQERYARDEAEDIFSEWSRDPEVTGQWDFSGLQQLAAYQWCDTGESWFNKRRIKWAGVEFRWQALEGDRIAFPSGAMKENERFGVTLDSDGRPISYSVRSTHPGDYSFSGKATTYVNVPADQIVHLFLPTRPGQTRGIPLLAPSLETFEYLAKYLEAEMYKARMQACVGIIRKSNNALAQAIAGSYDTDSKGNSMQKFEPGMTIWGGPNEEILPFNTQSPSANLENYYKACTRIVSAGSGLFYELVSKDYSASTYSSTRSASIDVRKGFRRFQGLLISKLCQPSIEEVLTDAALKGIFKSCGSFENFTANKRLWCASSWIPNVWEWIDLEAEANASETKMRLGLSSLVDEAAAAGKDWEEVLRQQKRVADLRKELGLSDPLSSTASKSKPKPEEMPVNIEEEDVNKDDQDEEADNA